MTALAPQVLLVVDSTVGLDRLARLLRGFGLSPIVALASEQALRLAKQLSLAAAVIFCNGEGSPSAVVRELELGDVPTLLVADPETLGHSARARTIIGIPAPSTPEEVAGATASAVGREAREDPPEALEAGPLRIDLAAGLAYLEERPLHLPRKQFSILVELARAQGRPVSSEEFVTKLWPKDTLITSEDVHGHIYRLRRLIGDSDRVQPLVVNRRGFGYLLNLDGFRTESHRRSAKMPGATGRPAAESPNSEDVNRRPMKLDLPTPSAAQ